MRDRVSKPRAHRSHLKLSKAAQGKLLDTTTSKSTGLLPSHRDRSLVGEDLAQGTTPLQPKKRQLDAISASDSFPAKRARLTQRDVQTESLRRSARLQARLHPLSNRYPIQPVPPAPPDPQTKTNAGSVPLPSKRARLTRKNLRWLNKMTNTTIEGSKSTAKTLSTTSSGFEVQALKNGILDRVDSKAPANLDDQRARLNRDRETASPTDSTYEDYVAAVTTAPNKQTMIYETAKLLKKYNDKGYRKVLNQAFTAFPKEVGFNNGLSAPQPDLVEGLQLRQFLPFPVNEQFDGAALIKDNPYSITLPHLAGEWKGPGKDMNKVRVQSAYDGAALVYGRNQALEFLGETESPDHAAVSTFSTDGTNINFFSHYSAPSKKGDTTEYHQYPIMSTNLMNSFDGFKQGRKQLRNLQEDARNESYALRDRLIGHWKATAPSGHSAVTGGDLDGIPEEPWPIPAPESDPFPDDNNGYTQPPRSTKPTRHKHTSRKVPPEDVHSTDDEASYEIINISTYAPTPPLSSKHSGHQHKVKRQLQKESSSTHSRSCSSHLDDSESNSSKKRKPSSHGMPKSESGQAHQSAGADYWEWDAAENCFFHRHADGTVTWADE